MKKLLNKKGSVLFLVVVVMSILLVVASATYYIVSNQRQSVEVHYNSEQSYQTAYSVSQTVQKYLYEYKHKIQEKPSLYKGSIFQKMVNSGDTPINITKDLAQYGLGEYDITITKTDSASVDGKIQMSFDVEVKAETNGEKTSFVQVWVITLSEEDTPYFTRFLTCTGEDGGSGRDAYMQAGTIFGDAYFENEYTYVTNTRMQKSFYSLGTIVDDGIVFEDVKDKEIVVNGTYYCDTTGGSESQVKRLMVGRDFYDYAKTLQNGAVFVGQDFHFETNMGDANNTTIFVQRDCYLDGMLGKNVDIYVSGDLYLGTKGKYDWTVNNIYVLGNVYFGGSGTFTGNIYYSGEMKDIWKYSPNKSWITSSPYSGWLTENSAKIIKDTKENIENAINNSIKEKSTSLSSEPDNKDAKDIFGNWNEVIDYIADSTEKGTYRPWNAENYFNTDPRFADAPTIQFNEQIAKYPAGLADYQQVNMTDASGKQLKSTIGKNGNNYIIASIKESCRLRPCESGIDPEHSIVEIDATNEDIYIYLDCDEDTYSFFKTGKAAKIVISGTHSVIFILPENKNYNNQSQTFIGHIELARYITGKTTLEEMREISIAQVAATKIQNQQAQTKSDMFVEDASTNTTKFNPATFGPDIHNNIFLVSNGIGTTLDFDNSSGAKNGNCQFTFAGYVYAPHMVMNYYSSTAALSFVGGIIVGCYHYSSRDSALCFIDPYPSDVVAKLISESSGASYDPSDSDSDQKVEIDFVSFK